MDYSVSKTKLIQITWDSDFVQHLTCVNLKSVLHYRNHMLWVIELGSSEHMVYIS